jgi:hypothetical protein
MRGVLRSLPSAQGQYSAGGFDGNREQSMLFERTIVRIAVLSVGAPIVVGVVPR